MRSQAALSARVSELTGRSIARLAAIGGGSFGRPYRATADDGREYFVKVAPDHQPDLMEHEARGLRWLAEPESDGGASIARVIAQEEDVLVLDWIRAESPTRPAAQLLGAGLATMHRAEVDHFGCPKGGFIASEELPIDTEHEDWAAFYAQARLAPFLDRAVRARSIAEDDRRAVTAVIEQIHDLAGPAEQPARVHGDLWSGNVLWTSSTGVLIDPSAHGGHRESDLAMLALFGLPFLDVVLSAYDQVWPLAPGWQERVSLHQIFPLLVHAILFGGHYGQAAGSAARSAISQAGG